MTGYPEATSGEAQQGPLAGGDWGERDRGALTPRILREACQHTRRGSDRAMGAPRTRDPSGPWETWVHLPFFALDVTISTNQGKT